MSEQQRDGGPAFPHTVKGACLTQYHSGMTLRDWFAGQAMIGLVPAIAEEADAINIGRAAYKLADAMLAARDD
jgi:hypothetical protein